MRLYGERLLLSAGDLNSFLGCRHATNLARRLLDGEPIEKGPADATLELVQRRGLAHEAAFLRSLEAEGRQVVVIPDGRNLEARVDATTAAMQQGAQVIFQGALARGRWHGFADFLVRVEQPSNLGPWCYEVVDTKLASRAKASHAVQLALYADLVEAVQGVPPPALRVRLGTGREEVLRPADFVHYTRQAGKRLEDFLAQTERQTAAEPCGHCSLCDFSARCEAEWERTDHLSRVANIRRDQARKLREAGISTLAALAALPDGKPVKGIGAATLARLRRQARLQDAARGPGSLPLEHLPEEPGRGMARLPRPDTGDVYFDMEGDPLFPDGGLEYLFGVVTRGWFSAFWAHDRAQEKRTFEAFMDDLTERLAAHPGAHVYHYNHYEPNALKTLARRHGTREAAVDALLRAHRFVDLLKVVRESLCIGAPSYSLKTVERFFRGARTGEVGNAADSIVAYEKFCDTGDPQILREIADYNEDDCHATAALHRWLLGLRPKAMAWYAPPEPDAARAEALAGEEAERATLRRDLLSGVTDPAEVETRTLLIELCEFHRREGKSDHWAMFDRMEREPEELVEDAECLGTLSPDGPPVPDGKQVRLAFRFPSQETRLRVGNQPRATKTGKGAGTIVELDEAVQRVVLRMSAETRDALPADLSLGPGWGPKVVVLENALGRVAASVAAGDGKFRALLGLLRRDPPRIAGLAPGVPILVQGEDAAEAMVRAVRGLRDSHLVVQGPPGTGKTWATARAILALLGDGKRVGVASNSHKAINNLLAEVERAAEQARVNFQGVKCASDKEDDFEGRCIKTVRGNAGVKGAPQLVAGTAWLFARPEHAEKLDVLFVDEAGQVSLANLIAMGTAARNIVLVGDQQQLAQPVKGRHPAGAEASALDHLLQGRPTVPPERGILLDTSRRMHPAVCGWVSETFYEGRLRAHPDATRQMLILPDPAPQPLLPTGLVVQPVAHEGRSRTCPEEAQEARRIYDALVDRIRWVDRDGTERTLRAEDLLVVALYNLQVKQLQRALPEGARVGTVDRFQGQEAAVVIVSMASSSAEDLPRDMAFAFNPNRLNVAVSRAKCLAVVLASPLLLEAPCSTVEQLRLVNTLCSAQAWRGDAAALADPALQPSWRHPGSDWDLPSLSAPLAME